MNRTPPMPTSEEEWEVYWALYQLTFHLWEIALRKIGEKDGIIEAKELRISELEDAIDRLKGVNPNHPPRTMPLSQEVEGILELTQPMPYEEPNAHG